jgi:sugar lactone lactonase YvrE
MKSSPAFALGLGVVVACGGSAHTPGVADDAADGAAPDGTVRCEGNACTCPSGETPCSGACANVQTDLANCGGCGIACIGVCALGRCKVTVALGVSPSSIAVDAKNVYWADTDNQGASIVSRAISGGEPTTLASDQSGPDSIIAVDATSVYWTNSYTGSVMKVPIGGGAIVTLASAQGASWGIAVNATSVYWTSAGAGTVLETPLAGGPIVTLASGQSSPYGIAVDATNVYWVDGAGTNAVMAVPLAGGTPSRIAVSPVPPLGIAALPLTLMPGASAKRVYWTAPMYPGGLVLMAPVEGGSVTTIASGRSNPWSIAVDATTVYWGDLGTNSTASTGTVMSAPLGGGTPTTLATQQSPSGIAVDATTLYWTNRTDGTVVRMTPK